MYPLFLRQPSTETLDYERSMGLAMDLQGDDREREWSRMEFSRERSGSRGVEVGKMALCSHGEGLLA